ncbi:hypothetical protein, partial [[Pseudomonas] boreopolis]|uniref:hypothetical protein n=1 Tax=Xanthomonas boreopolis TaxID=86183 RepID=UPI003D9BBFD9
PISGNVSLAKQLTCCLIKRLQDGQSSFLQASAQITCAHFQRTSGPASAPFPHAPKFPSKRAAHYSRLFVSVNTSLRAPTSTCRPSHPKVFAEASPPS